MTNKYQQCTRCVMDNSSPSIFFDKLGICNYCKSFEKLAENTINRPFDVRKKELEELVSLIKQEGTGKKYDCIIGLSGGVDSSYVAYLVHKHGLRPLAVHFDNGWNSELSVKNIESIVNHYKFDLFTYVVDWEEFRDLQLSYLKASVIDIEAITDHMIVASLFKLANKHNVKYIIGGTNVATEGILPADWVFNKSDLTNILNIHKKFGKVPLRNYPSLGYVKRLFYTRIKKISFVEILNLVDYSKKIAKDTITNEFGWRDYGGKHYESVWTKFYQGYILPKKFKVDKRRAHLSTLISNGEISRDEALIELNNPPIPTNEEKDLVEYVCRKLELSEQELVSMMHEKPVDHSFYGTEKDNVWLKIFVRVYNFFAFRLNYKLLYLK